MNTEEVANLLEGIYYYDTVADTANDGRPGHPRYYALLEELADIHRDKCRVYGNAADPFANFSAGERFGFSKVDMVVMRLVEKLERFRNDKARDFALVPGMGEDNESPERTYREIASLFLILVIMLEESRG